MTFSDAEEDQPSSLQNRNSSSNETTVGATGGAGPGDATLSGSHALLPQNGVKSDEPPISNASTTSVVNGLSVTSDTSKSNGPSPNDASAILLNSNLVNPTAAPSTSSSVSPTPVSNNLIGHSPNAEITLAEPSTSYSETSEDSNNRTSLSSHPGLAEVAQGNDLSNPTALESEKILEKLQQIQGYIQQTTTAMQALENEGNLNKIGQYNTLVKCMRDLKNSKSKLVSHLSKLKENSSVEENRVNGSENSTEANGNGVPKESGSESIGVVGDMNGEANRPSLHDRLARHESEQEELSARLRESLVRRQELMARYQATRERLNNLKRQRLGIVQEERNLLHTHGAPENLYEDPIPGAETWTIGQLETAITDFRSLREKVDRLYEAYSAKIQATEESDTETHADLRRKLEQIFTKRTQIENAITQLIDLLEVKRQREESDGLTSSTVVTQVDSEEIMPNDASAPIVESSVNDVNMTNTDRQPSEDNVEENTSDLEGAAGAPIDVGELLSKQQHLQTLKDQLNSMKRLLHVTQESMSSRRETDSELESIDIEVQNPDIEQSNALESGEDTIIDSTIVGVHGDVIHLSEIERRDPSVVAKYRQLSEAKKRLAKMQEVMCLISEAQHSGRSLDEVLSDENMAILNEAKEEEEESGVNNQPVSSINTGRFQTEREDSNFSRSRHSTESLGRQQQSRAQTANTPPTQPIKYRLNQMPRKNSNDQPEWEREKEISAMHFHLKKKTPGIPAVNDGSKAGREKGAVNKQTRSWFQEGNNDPGMVEVIALQEELREKKNALEALMKRMGKSSSFTVDNISDNISENVSDMNSETLEKPSASWGAHQSHYDSDHGQSDEEVVDINEAEHSLRYCPSVPTSQTSDKRHQPLQPKNSRNRHNQSSSKASKEKDHNQYSVNNLSSSLPRSVRPKHNRYRGGSVPVTSWETLTNGNASMNQPSKNKVQNTVSAALTQLNQVQETINNLYDDLHLTEAATAAPPRPQPVPFMNAFGTTPVYPQPQLQPNFGSNPQSFASGYGLMQPLLNTPGRGELGAMNHMLAGLQQCFSQLYLHSLEIQSLSKHLQLIDQREKSVSPIQQRDVSQDRRSERFPVPQGRDNGEQNFNRRVADTFIPNLGHSSHGYEGQKPDIYQQQPACPNPRINDGIPNAAGVSNPLYGRLSSSHPSPWLVGELEEETDLTFGNKNFFPSFERSNSDEVRGRKEEIFIDSSSQFPVESEEISENIRLSAVSSQLQQHQSSDVLNNQVLPGSRANNYWDNFRSYSRQNPLSTAAKRNTGERLSLSGSSTPGRAQGVNSSGCQQPSMGFENKNRQYNMTSGTSSSINKASDKNSSSSRCQNKGLGARSRYPVQQSNSVRMAVGNPHNFNDVDIPTADQRPRNDAQKRNNRPTNYGDTIDPECQNQNDHLQNFSFVNCNESMQFNTNSSVDIANSGNPRRRAIGKRTERMHNLDDVEHICNEQCPPSPINLRLQRQNTTSLEDLSTSETYSQVVREAESLMQKHSQQPQFLLQLFHHASKITSNTDQQVALELLRELSNQRQTNIQHNRWNSNTSGTPNGHLLLPAPIRDSNYRNITRFSNKNSHNVHGISGSDASESGMTSEEDDNNKLLYQMVKNLTPTPSGGVSATYAHRRSSPQAFSDVSPSHPSSVGMSPMHVPPILPLNQHPQSAMGKDSSKESVNLVGDFNASDRIKTEPLGNKFHRLRKDSESSLRNFNPNSSNYEAGPSTATIPISTNASNSGFTDQQLPRNKEDRHRSDNIYNNNRKLVRKSPKRDLIKPSQRKSNFVPSKNDKKNYNIRFGTNTSSQEPSTGFESIVSAALKEVLMCFELPEENVASNSQILETLHHSIMRQVEVHSTSLGFSLNFVASIESQLKATLQSFCGKRFTDYRQELAASVTQILIHQYCSLLVHQDSSLDLSQTQTQSCNSTEEFLLLNRPVIEVEAIRSSLNLSSHPYNPQPYANSLFAPQEGPAKASKFHKSNWSFTPNIPTEPILTNRENNLGSSVAVGHSKEDVNRNDATNVAKGKGAISKTSGSSNHESIVTHHDNSNVTGESPIPDASFPESWIISKVETSSEIEGLSASESHISNVPRGRDLRDAFDGFDHSKVEANATEADQDDHAVHDLAEADQSQDVVEAQCVIPPSVEDEVAEVTAAAMYFQPFPQNKDSLIRLISRKNLTLNSDVPEQGLDEVPTRLLSGLNCVSPPPTNSINESHLTESSGGSCDSKHHSHSHSHRHASYSNHAAISQGQSQQVNGTQNISNQQQSSDSSAGKAG